MNHVYFQQKLYSMKNQRIHKHRFNYSKSKKLKIQAII